MGPRRTPSVPSILRNAMGGSEAAPAHRTSITGDLLFMWRMTPRLATATLTATLALAFSAAGKAEAAALQSYSYSTSGSISGMSGDQPIQFWGAPVGGTLTTPGGFALGEFITNPLPASATLTYDHTPFTIDLIVRDALAPNSAGPGSSPSYFDADYKISGVLNGSITGAGSSDMMATITSISATAGGVGGTPPFSASDLQITAPQGIIAPNGQNPGFSTLMGQVLVPGLPAPAPEPASIAVFGVALAGWACCRRSRPKAKGPGRSEGPPAP